MPVTYGGCSPRNLGSSPSPGPPRLHRLEENLAGANIEFTAGELDDLTTTASQLQVVGDRLPQRMLEPTEQ